MDWSLVLRQCLENIAHISIIIIPGGKKVKIEGNKQQKIYLFVRIGVYPEDSMRMVMGLSYHLVFATCLAPGKYQSLSKYSTIHVGKIKERSSKYYLKT